MNELVVDPTFGTDIHDLTSHELSFIDAYRDQSRDRTIVNAEYMARLHDELGQTVMAECCRQRIKHYRLRVDCIRRSDLARLLERVIEARAKNPKLAPR